MRTSNGCFAQCHHGWPIYMVRRKVYAAQWCFELHVLDLGQRKDRAPETPLRFFKTGADMSTITDDTDPVNGHIVAQDWET